MRKIISKRKRFELPEPGTHWAKLVAITDAEPKQTDEGEKEQIRFEWELETLNSRGEPFVVYDWTNAILYRKSKLRQRIFELTGEMPKENKDGDLEYDDWEKLYGLRVQLRLKHHTVEKTGKTYARVVEIIRPPTSKEEAEARRVARATKQVKRHVKDAVPEKKSDPDPDDPDESADAQFVADDSDIPF